MYRAVRIGSCLPMRVRAIETAGLNCEPERYMQAGTHTISTSPKASATVTSEPPISFWAMTMLPHPKKMSAKVPMNSAMQAFAVVGMVGSHSMERRVMRLLMSYYGILSRAVLAAWVLLWSLLLVGCSDTPSKEVTSFRPVAPELLDDPRFGVFPTERIDAVLGLPLVVLVELAGGYRPEDVGDVVLDDGRVLATRVVWVGVKPGEPGGSWLEPAGEWTVRMPAEVAGGMVPRGEIGTWAVLLDPPIDAVGQGIWIAGRRHAVNWLPDPAVVATRVSSRAWLSPLTPEMRDSQRLRLLVEPLRRSPFRRWRYRLMVGELSPRVERRVVEVDGTVRRRGSQVRWDSEAFGSGALELLASQLESKWTIGLARLDQADDELAVRIRQRLCAIVDFGAGEIAPLWPFDQEGLDRLLADLLDQQLQPHERVRRAKLWLDDQPVMAAWIVSDAPRSGRNRGDDGGGGASLATVAVANLSPRPRATSVFNQDAQGGPELSSLASMNARAYEVACLSAAGEIPFVVARVGDDERVLAVRGGGLKATPPGLRIDRFFDDWSLRTLQAPAAPGGNAYRCGALLYRDPAKRWVLYVECASPDQDQKSESLRVTLGPEGAAGDLVIRLSPGTEPEIVHEQSAPPRSPFVPDVEVESFPGGWSARLVVPERSIESGSIGLGGGRLRLGLEHTDSLGRRSAWPRPMLPWQGASGRAAIDLSAWGGLGR